MDEDEPVCADFGPCEAACTCEKAADGGYNPANEVDFTNYSK